MALYRDEGVVLTTTKLGEADRIITLFTRDHGKVRAVAKGVRRTKSRFGGRVEPFMRVDLLLGEGRTFDTISQAESIAAYASAISGDYEAYRAANVIVETLNDLVTSEHEPAAAQYRLLVGALNALTQHRHDARMIAESYVLRALALAGWRQRLDSCVVCGRTDRLTHLSAAACGVMCQADHTPEAKPIGALALTQLRALAEGDWAVLDGAEPDPQAARAVEEWARYYLERPVRSMRLLD